MKQLFFSLLLVSALMGCRSKAPELSLIPIAKSADCSGEVCRLADDASLFVGCDDFRAAAAYLEQALAPTVKITLSDDPRSLIRIVRDEQLGRTDEYRLTADGSGIELAAATYGGVVAGIATLRQSIALQGGVPSGSISDFADFAWRGFMLDVARHFYTKEEVMRLVDYMALYKFNKFHWHLTDDEGWRIQLDAYPELTDKGAWRELDRNDKECLRRAEQQQDSTFLLPESKCIERDGKRLYGGFYTKDDIREVVAYAAARGIDVIPEIDMPGHSQRAIAAYPELSCFDEASWGEAFSAPMCLGKDLTIEFCRKVYREVFDLFPYDYVHIGGDEVEKANWERCPACQQRIRRENLKDEKQLQSWFIKQMTDFFHENGRKLIGWDEIEEGGLADNQVVMWWRSWAPQTLKRTVERGNEVIVSDNEFLYFTDDQSRGTLAKVYGLDVAGLFGGTVPSSVKGLQCHLWSERAPSFEKACYRIFPRLFAVSELAWGKSGSSYADFSRRVYAHMRAVLEADGMNYRMPDPSGYCDRNVFTDSVRVRLTMPMSGGEIRYTTDGTVPTRASALYGQELVLHESTLLNLRCYSAAGFAGAVIPAVYTRSEMLPAVATEELQEGLRVDWYDYTGEACSEIDAAPRLDTFRTATIAIPEGARGNIGLVFSGYVEVPEDAIYSFWLNSDDGSLLKIDERVVIDNDGPHSRQERSGQVALRKGMHRVEARYFDHNGGVLEFGVVSADGERQPLPEEIRFYSK